MSKNIKLKNLLKENDMSGNDKLILNFEKVKDDIIEELPKVMFDDFTGMELKVLTDQLQQILWVLKHKSLPNGSMNEDSALIKDYLPKSIKDFVANSDTNSPYKPQIKLHWSNDKKNSDTKWLAVTWDMIAKLIDVVSGK